MEKLKDKKLGYGKLMKDMKAENFNFFGKDALNCAEGIVYKEEDIKSAVEWLRNKIKYMDTSEGQRRYQSELIDVDYTLEIIDEAFEDITQ